MKNYSIYFELFGKKMKTKVFASSEDEAKEKLKSKIIFHKIEAGEKVGLNDINEVFDELMDILKK